MSRYGWIVGAMLVPVLIISCNDGGKAPSGDTAGCCEECCAEPSSSFPAYDYNDFVEANNDRRANWIHKAVPRVVTVNVDAQSLAQMMKSFSTSEYFTVDEVSGIVQDHATYWNMAGADITVAIGDTGFNCCNSMTDADAACQDCLADGENSVFVWDGDSTELDPSLLASAATFTMADAEGECMLGADIVFFTGYWQDDGTWCEYNWTYPYTDSDTTDCSDGVKSKAFKDSSVHEFGHLFGLGHQSQVDFPTSAMNTDGCRGCNYDTVQEPDITALVELYQQCQ